MKRWKQCDGTECESIWVMKWMWKHMSNEMNWWKQSDGTAESVNKIMRTVCNTECEYIWGMKRSDENSVMALNVNMWIYESNEMKWWNSVMALRVNAYEWWYECCWKCKWRNEIENYENSVMALNMNTYE